MSVTSCLLTTAGLLLSLTAPLGAVPFVRADSNADGAVSIADAVESLDILFRNGGEFTCRDAADSNDDGRVDISDVIHTLLFLFVGAASLPTPDPRVCGEDPTDDSLDCDAFPPCEDNFAEVLAVLVSGAPGAFSFSVTVRSPDTGCAQYADWWEVITPEGELVHRRILLHSHVSEQPFRRSGGSIAVDADDDVIVRAHMNTTGYGPQAQRGTPGSGFESDELPAGFFDVLSSEPPLADGCDF